MSTETETKVRIEICVLGCKEKFKTWIDSRGGVKVWRNINLSNPDAGNQFTPALTGDLQSYPKPHWSVEFQELVTDLGRFKFVKEIKEIKRVRIAVRQSSNGLMLKLTDASSRKVRKACEKVKEQYGTAGMYRFEFNEAIIEVPVFED